MKALVAWSALALALSACSSGAPRADEAPNVPPEVEREVAESAPRVAAEPAPVKGGLVGARGAAEGEREASEGGAQVEIEDDALTALVRGESFGGIGLDVPVARIAKLLGAPSERGERAMSEATGQFEERWVWDGVEVYAVAPDESSPLGVPDSIALTAPFMGKSARGVGLGSTRAEVRAAYPEFLTEDAESDALRIGDEYWGLVFVFESGRVGAIHAGTLAE